MKERRKLASDKDDVQVGAQVDSITESLSDVDKGLIDNIKLKRELALERAKNALSQSENAELHYNNIILQLAMKYGLKEGDIIAEDGTIKRNEGK